MSINTYSPSDVTLLLDGYKIEGWESINIKRGVQSYSFIKGRHGKNTRVKNFDTSAIIEVAILQTADSHEILNEIHTQDTAPNVNSARLSVTLKDRSGTSAFQSDDAYVIGFPEVRFSQDFEMRVWSIQCQTTHLYKIGGNLRPTTPVFDTIFNKVIN